MHDQLKLMQMGQLGKNQRELEKLRLRIMRLIDDLRMYSFYEDAAQPEKVNAKAALQAAEELVAAQKQAYDLKKNIEGLREEIGLEEVTLI